MGLNRPVLLAATLILFQIVITVIGPLDLTTPPATLLTGALLYVLLGILAIGTVLAPAQAATALVSKDAISGAALIGLGLYLVGQGTAAFTSGNYIFAGAFYIGGGLLIVIGLVYPTGAVQKILAEASK